MRRQGWQRSRYASAAARRLVRRSNPPPLWLRCRPLQSQCLRSRRLRQTTAAFQEQYAARAGIEGTLSQGTRAFGLRRARYRGLVKTHLHHVLTAVAINVVRLVAWNEEAPFAKTRRSPFARLPSAA